MTNRTGAAARLHSFQKFVLAAAFVAALGGCSIMPNNVAGPVITPHDQSADPNNMKADYQVSTTFTTSKPIVAGKSSDYDSAILPVEPNVVGVKSQIMALRGSYRARQKELLYEIDVASNFQFAGVLASAIGVAVNNRITRNVGAGTAGLATLWTSHYQLMEQATNYKTAATALDCVYRDIDGVPDLFWKKAYDQTSGQLTFSLATFKAAETNDVGTDASTAYDALSKMFTTLNDTVYQIDQKLQASQAAVTINPVQPSDLQNAFKAQLASNKVSGNVTPSVTGGASGNAQQTAKDSDTADANVILNQNAVDGAKAAAGADAPRLIAMDASAVPDALKSKKAALDKANSDLSKALTAQKKANKAKSEASRLEEAVDAGGLDNAIQLPAAVATCVTAMGG